MQQELFRLPFVDIPIYGYGLMLVLGFLGALYLSRFLSLRSRIDPEIFVNCGIIALVAGIFGARLSHVLENWSTYTDPARSFGDNVWAAVNIRSGGLTFYGGFIFATFCCIAYGLYKKVPIRRGMDIVAPCLMVGLGFGRIGCFMNGCCEGAECDTLPAPVAVEFPYATNPYIRHFDQRSLPPTSLPPREATKYNDRGEPTAPMTQNEIAATYAKSPQIRDRVLSAVAPLHSNRVFNAQLASTVTAFLIAFLLVAYYAQPHAPGRVFALMLLVEAPARFILEMMRAEPAFVGPTSVTQTLTFLPFDLSFSMFVSVWLTAIGAVLWFGFRGKPDDMTEPKTPVMARTVGV
jgi:phosphatidylglycerol---prolipoprotein diacylglyceryl transferase